MTGCEREYLEMVSRTSPEVFRQIMLCLGHTELMAEKSRVRSSFLASSSTADLWPHSLSSTWRQYHRQYLENPPQLRVDNCA